MGAEASVVASRHGTAAALGHSGDTLGAGDFVGGSVWSFGFGRGREGEGERNRTMEAWRGGVSTVADSMAYLFFLDLLLLDFYLFLSH